MGGHESNDYTLVLYMLNYETGELTDSPKTLDLSVAYGEDFSGVKIVLNHASQVSTNYAASNSRIDIFARQEVGGQFNGLSHKLELKFDASTQTIIRFV